jgi:hypothetical protein
VQQFEHGRVNPFGFTDTADSLNLENSMTTDHVKLYLLAALWIVVCSLHLHAQPATGTIEFVVKDQLGAAVADADITVTKGIGGNKPVSLTARTDKRGIARITRIPSGEYRVDVAAKGFREYLLQNVVIGVDEKKAFEIALEIAPIESNVDIEGSETVDAANTGGSTDIDKRIIDNLPDDPEELERALKLLGQAVTGEDLPISVNGVQGGKLPPKDQIQQVRVNQNVFSAQYDSPWGGGIEIFTRAGVDRFRGYITFSFADARLNAADFFLREKVPYQLKNYFFSISGPLFGKKASFGVNGNQSSRRAGAVVNALVLNDDLEPVEFKTSLLTPSRNANYGFTVNADPNPKHKLYLNYSIGSSRSENQNVGGFSLPSRANNSKRTYHYLQFSDTYLINSNVVNQTRFLLSYDNSKNFGGRQDPAINVLDSFFGGGSQNDSSSSGLRLDASNDTTWQMGRYALGFGFRLRGERIRQDSVVNFGGTYTFSGRTAPVLDANNGPVIGSDGNVVREEIDSLEVYRRTLYFQGLGFSSLQIRELGGGANQFTISGGDPLLTGAQYDVGAYVQNSYKLSDTIALSFGLRYEAQTNITSNFNFAPRLGFVWAPKAKAEQNPWTILPRVSVGYGVFFSRFGLNNTMAIRQATDPNRVQYFVMDPSILDLFPSVPTVDALQNFAQPRTRRQISGDFETPYQTLLNVTVSKRLPKGLSLNFTYSRGATYRQSVTQNINAPFAGTFDATNPTSAERPFGNVGNIYETRSLGSGSSDRYSVNLSFPQKPTFVASLRYSYGRSRSDVVGNSGSPFDPYDFAGEFAPTAFDGVHNVGGFFSFTWLKTFSISSDFSISSGTRFNITTGRDTNGDGSFSERPAFASDSNKPGIIRTPYGNLDPNPQPGDRIISRNFGRGSAAFNFNSSISKAFNFNENKAKKTPPKQSLRITVRINNVFNFFNKGNPIGNMASPNFLSTLSQYSDGSTLFINGVQQDVFSGRSINLNAGFSF